MSKTSFDFCTAPLTLLYEGNAFTVYFLPNSVGSVNEPYDAPVIGWPAALPPRPPCPPPAPPAKPDGGKSGPGPWPNQRGEIELCFLSPVKI